MSLGINHDYDPEPNPPNTLNETENDNESLDDNTNYSSDKTGDSESVSSVSITKHAKKRLVEREMDERCILQAKKYGTKTELLGGIVKISHKNLRVIMDGTLKKVITAYWENGEVYGEAVEFYNRLVYDIDNNIMTLELLKKLVTERFICGLDFGVWPRKPIIVHIAKKGRLDLLKYLIEECNYDYMVTNKKNSTILHEACYYGYTEMVKYILDNLVVDLNVRNNHGETAQQSFQNSVEISRSLKKELENMFQDHNSSTSTAFEVETELQSENISTETVANTELVVIGCDIEEVKPIEEKESFNVVFVYVEEEVKLFVSLPSQYLCIPLISLKQLQEFVNGKKNSEILNVQLGPYEIQLKIDIDRENGNCIFSSVSILNENLVRDVSYLITKMLRRD